MAKRAIATNPAAALAGFIGKFAPQHQRLIRNVRTALRRLSPDVLHSRNLGTLDAQWTAFVAGVPVRIHGENGRDTYDLDGTNFRYNLLRRSVRPLTATCGSRGPRRRRATSASPRAAASPSTP